VEEIQVLMNTPGNDPNAAPTTRLMVSVERYEAEVARAERKGVPCKYTICKADTGPPSFDGLSKAEQKKVVARQVKRAAAKEAYAAAVAEANAD